MTTQEPTLAQQIEYQQQLCENYQPNPVVYLIAKTILASLRRLQAIEQDDCVRVPRDQVEAAVKAEREECAKLCERAIDENVKLMPPNYWGLGYNSALVNRAAAIRARGEK